MGVLKNVRREVFCQNLAVLLMRPIDAYVKAGFTAKNNNVASVAASRLQDVPEVARRIDELMNRKLIVNEKKSLRNLHDKAIDKAEEMLNGDNKYIAASMVKEVLSRTEPIVKQSANISVTVNSKEADRRLAILEAKRKQITAVEIKPKE